MSLTNEDKEWLKRWCGKTERIGLYILVICIFLHGCSCPVSRGIEAVEETTGETS
jgi:hypothetical protein